MANPNTPHPVQNHLLSALPDKDLALLMPHLELVPMALGQMLYEPGGQMRHAYFPTTTIVSLHYVTESGASAETAGVLRCPRRQSMPRMRTRTMQPACDAARPRNRRWT